MSIKAPLLDPKKVEQSIRSLQDFLFKLEAETNRATPPGTVAAYPGTVAPEGWVLLDGASYSVDLYPELAKVLEAVGSSFSVPVATQPAPFSPAVWIIKV